MEQLKVTTVKSRALGSMLGACIGNPIDNVKRRLYNNHICMDIF